MNTKIREVFARAEIRDTIEPKKRPLERFNILSHQWGSNPRPPPYHGGALPAEL